MSGYFIDFEHIPIQILKWPKLSWDKSTIFIVCSKFLCMVSKSMKNVQVVSLDNKKAST